MNLERLQRAAAFLLDMDGTVYLGDRLIPGALDFVRGVERRGQRTIFLTNNSSRGKAQYVEKLNRLGIEVSADVKGSRPRPYEVKIIAIA